MERSQVLQATRALAAGRVAVGTALVVAPRLAGRGWMGDAVDQPGTRVAIRALGIRDALMGAIALHTAEHRQVAPRWAAACAVADAVDFGATLVARGSLPPVTRDVSLGVAGGAALMGLALSRHLAEG